jgi:hypothetical protein
MIRDKQRRRINRSGEGEILSTLRSLKGQPNRARDSRVVIKRSNPLFYIFGEVQGASHKVVSQTE